MRLLLSKDEKTKLLEEFRSSGQTQVAFAEAKDIKSKTLARWIYQQRLETKQNQDSVEFVEVKRTLISFSKCIKIRKTDIEIELASFDMAVLKEILCAVKAL